MAVDLHELARLELLGAEVLGGLRSHTRFRNRPPYRTTAIGAPQSGSIRRCPGGSPGVRITRRQRARRLAIGQTRRISTSVVFFLPLRRPRRKNTIIKNIPMPALAAMSVCFLSSTLPWISPWNALNFDSRSFARDPGVLGGLCLGHQFGSSFSDFLLILDTVSSEEGRRRPRGRSGTAPTTSRPVATPSHSVWSSRRRPSISNVSPRPSTSGCGRAEREPSTRSSERTERLLACVRLDELDELDDRDVLPVGRRLVGAGLRLIRHGPRFYHVRRNSIIATTSSSASSSSSRRCRGESAQSSR